MFLYIDRRKNMSILRPQKILFKELRKVENILEEIKVNEELENIILENYKTENIEFNY